MVVVVSCTHSFRRGLRWSALPGGKIVSPLRGFQVRLDFLFPQLPLWADMFRPTGSTTRRKQGARPTKPGVAGRATEEAGHLPCVA